MLIDEYVEHMEKDRGEKQWRCVKRCLHVSLWGGVLGGERIRWTCRCDVVVTHGD